jgi:hypothetical protein
MAVLCFCGCGTPVPRFPLGIRSINTRGTQVSDRLAWAMDVVGSNEPELQEWFDHGTELLAALVNVMHGVRDPRSLDERVVREWQSYGRKIEVVAVGMGLPSINAWLQDRN